MERGHKVLSVALSMALATMLWLPGSSAYAEQQEAVLPELIEEPAEPLADDSDSPEEEELPEEGSPEDEAIVEDEAEEADVVDPEPTDDEVQPTEEVTPVDPVPAEEEAEPEQPTDDVVVPTDDADPSVPLPEDEEAADEETAPVDGDEDSLDPAAVEPAPDKDDKKDKSSSDGTFSDVPADHWAYNVIRRAAKLSLVSGYSGDREGQFGPDDGISRAQASVILWRMAGSPEPISGSKSYSDVKAGAYYYKAVCWASSMGVVSGYSGASAGKFGPNDPITREQLAVMMSNYASRVAGISAKGSKTSFEGSADASSVSSWAEASVGWCFDAGILSGANGKVNPQNGATRAQAAKMVVGLYDRCGSSWQLSVKASDVAVRTGSSVTVTPMVSGVAEGITYTYYASYGSWSGEIGDTLQLSKPGVYTFTVRARDAAGKAQTSSVTVASYALSGLNVVSAGSSKWATEPHVGVRGGSVSGVEYRYTWSKVGASGSGVLRDWGSEPRVTFGDSTFGNFNCMVRITVEVRDAYGSLGTASKDISPDAMTLKAQGYDSPTDWLIMVNEKTCWVGIYRGGYGNWQRVEYWRCSCGGGGATPKGIFSIAARGYSFGSGYTCYWWTDYYLGTYAFHSIKYHEGTFDVLDGRLGYHISAGCIRLAIENAEYIYDYVPWATTVVIYR